MTAPIHPPQRLRSLDGLRGVAAVVVLLSHVMLTWPRFAEMEYNEGKPSDSNALETALGYTPLHLFWLGPEAVYLFFVLSGLVLTLPVLSTSFFHWKSYYPRRIVRIYGPVAAAVAFGILVVLLVPRDDAAGRGEWMQERPTEPTLLGTARDLVLIAGPSRLVSPLWSLQWEVLFSLLLPLYVVVARRWPAALPLKIVAILALITSGTLLGSSWLVFLPMFAGGALAAAHWEELRRRAAELRTAGWITVLTVAVLLSTSRWTLLAALPPERAAQASVVLAFIGCALFVLIGAFWRPAVSWLEQGVVQWLGRISFSLYLTHEPIVVAAGFLLPPAATWSVALTAVPLSLLVAALFYRWVEAPLHTLSKIVGRRVSRPPSPARA